MCSHRCALGGASHIAWASADQHASSPPSTLTLCSCMHAAVELDPRQAKRFSEFISLLEEKLQLGECTSTPCLPFISLRCCSDSPAFALPLADDVGNEEDEGEGAAAEGGEEEGDEGEGDGDDSDDDDEEEEEEEEEEDEAAAEGAQGAEEDEESVAEPPPMSDSIQLDVKGLKMNSKDRAKLRAGLQASIQALKEQELIDKLTASDPLLGA
jgi:hypothetical protein